jgi:hypothetical protein
MSRLIFALRTKWVTVLGGGRQKCQDEGLAILVYMFRSPEIDWRRRRQQADSPELLDK